MRRLLPFLLLVATTTAQEPDNNRFLVMRNFRAGMTKAEAIQAEKGNESSTQLKSDAEQLLMWKCSFLRNDDDPTEMGGNVPP